MNKDIVKGNWQILKGKVKTAFGKLTDDDIKRMDGSYEQLQGAIRKAYGYQEDIAKKEIDRFLDDNNVH